MKRAAVVVLAMVGCLSGTRTPGVKRCTYWFFVIGVHKECEQGPDWSGPVPATVDARPRVAWWCTKRTDGFGVCMRSLKECEDFKVDRLFADKTVTFGSCAIQEDVWCTPGGCFASRDSCVSVEEVAGRDGAECARGFQLPARPDDSGQLDRRH